MAGYYSPSPAPTPPPPPEGWLPYPWIPQYSDQYQATYYANPETGETTWTRPDPNVVYSQPPPDSVIAAVESNRGYSAAPGDMHNSHSAGMSGSSSGGGEAASFFAASGTTPQAPGRATSSYSSNDPNQQQQQQYDENGQPVDSERGLGKVIIGGGLAYFAYKKYKEYQRGKLNQQQFKPPYQAPNPNNQTPQLHPPHDDYNYVHCPQDHLRPPRRDGDMNANGGGYAYGGSGAPQPPMPAWDQKPSPSPYGGPPPNAYNAQAGSYQQQQPYGQPPASYPSQPPASYDPTPVPFNGGGAQQYGGPPPMYDGQFQNQYGNSNAYNQPPNGFASPTKSGWGDPRF